MAGIQSFENKLFHYGADNFGKISGEKVLGYGYGEDAKKKEETPEEDTVEEEEVSAARKDSLQRNCSLGFLIAAVILTLGHLCLLIFVTIVLLRQNATRHDSPNSNDGADGSDLSRIRKFDKALNETLQKRFSSPKIPTSEMKSIKKEINDRLVKISRQLERLAEVKQHALSEISCPEFTTDWQEWKRRWQDAATLGITEGLSDVQKRISNAKESSNNLTSLLTTYATTAQESVNNITSKLDTLSDEIIKNMKETYKVLVEIDAFKGRFEKFVEDREKAVDVLSNDEMKTLIGPGAIHFLKECMGNPNNTKKIRKAIPHFYMYAYDGRDDHQIADGGQDMFDYGNRVSIEAIFPSVSYHLNHTVAMGSTETFNKGSLMLTSIKSHPYQLIGYAKNMNSFTIEQCSDYGTDGLGKHEAGNDVKTHQKNDVYLLISYFYEEIWGTNDPSITKLFFTIEPGEVKDQDYLNKTWQPGGSTSKSCDKLTIDDPAHPFLFGYALLSRFENVFWNPQIGKPQIERYLEEIMDLCIEPKLNE